MRKIEHRLLQWEKECPSRRETWDCAFSRTWSSAVVRLADEEDWIHLEELSRKEIWIEVEKKHRLLKRRIRPLSSR